MLNTPSVPIVALIGAFALWLEYLIASSELRHLYYNEGDSGGRLYGVLLNRLLFWCVRCFVAMPRLISM